MAEPTHDFDHVVIGSGFGGSVSALRLSEKGYRVLVLEKGRWFTKADDFPSSNWDLRRWLWWPRLGWKGLFKISFFRHVTVLSGTGVGGGSLVYANTLPEPRTPFFRSGSWKDLCNWERELAPYYALAKRMLGVERHPYTSHSDRVMRDLAADMGVPQGFGTVDAAVHFGAPGVTVKDPYFGGKGPDRTGCIQCGGCMLGCRHNAKNTLDKNYLHLAQQLGCGIRANAEVVDVQPLSPDGNAGYRIRYRDPSAWFPRIRSVTARGVVFAGGVMGTLPLLLKLKAGNLPKLSHTLGHGVRTNSESLFGVTTFDRDVTFSEGIAIGSIVELDAQRHVEPVKYPPGNGIWRILMAPMVKGSSWPMRLVNMALQPLKQPWAYLRTYFVNDWSKRTHILLYMEAIDSTLRLKRGGLGGTGTALESGPAPTAFNPQAQDIAHRVERIVNGKAMVLMQETLLGIPTTAHILGGACMGADASTGVIDRDNRVFGYADMWVCDGSAISANPGVNPSLTSTAIAERAMAQVPKRTR
ncbi:MAG: GMC family oxidoreductase [Flavobacteriales bacterium]|nr:GMC family oxidoreductase [Flavobacteriales bacterium]